MTARRYEAWAVRRERAMRGVLFPQNSLAPQSQSFAPDLGRIRSHLVATGTNQLWSTLED